VLALFCGFFQILAGAPEMTLITFLFLFGWSLVYPYSLNKTRRMTYWGMLVLVVIALSAVQLIPFFEMFSQSQRIGTERYLTFSAWSLHPRRLPEIFIPAFFGNTQTLNVVDYWGAR